MRTVTSYCRICEALCGVLVDVDDDNTVVRVKGDPDHPGSRGYLCPKGAAMARTQTHPQRIVAPRRRDRDRDTWSTVSWDDALDEIAERLRRVIDQHGPHAVALYLGNPSAFSASHGSWAFGLMDGIGTRNVYTPGPQDQSARQVANHFLYGSTTVFPIPDVNHTDFLLVLGANPLVSHGSIMTNPRVRDDLRDVVRRGGRLVVVDPARTATAEAFEHVPVRPATDAWLLASMLQVIFAERLHHPAVVAGVATGLDELQCAVAEMSPERTAPVTGVDAATVRALARAFVAAPSAVAYARVGLGRTPTATLALYLVDCLNIVTGNFDRRGGWLFGQGAVEWSDLAGRLKHDNWGAHRTRVGGLKDVTRRLPWVLPQEILTPGDGQVRALFVTAGNPVVTAPDGDLLDEGLDGLDLLVCVDMFANETSEKADFILPVTTFLERSDIPLMLMGFMLRPWVQATKAVVEPPPDVREEWWIYRELGRRLGIDAPVTNDHPREVADGLLRRSVFADRLGVRDVESPLAFIEDTYPHGVEISDRPPVGLSPKRIAHEDAMVHIGESEVLRMLATIADVGRRDDDQLLLIGRRDLRSINSWMHGHAERPPTLFVNSTDADRLGLVDGEVVTVVSGSKSVQVPVEVGDRVMAGVVSYPHGWDEQRTGGVNINRLLSADVAYKDPISGASHLDGVPVVIHRTVDRKSVV